MADAASDQARKISDQKYADGAEFERTSKIYMRGLVPAAPPSLRVLDIGCGTGLNASQIAASGHDVVGVDVSDVAIEKFKECGFEGYVCDVIEGMPFEDNSFDLVFAAEVIEHIADTEAFLQELFRVLKPGGRLILSTLNSAFWGFRVFAVLGRTLSEVQHPGHIRFFSVKGLTAWCRNSGFTDVAASGRNIYFILGEPLGTPFGGLLRTLRFNREFRFKTKKYFWHLSRFTKNASSFWTDTQIVTARKPGQC